MKTTLASLLILSLVSAFPASAEDADTALVTDLEKALTGILAVCKKSSDSDACILNKVERERSLYDGFLDDTTPGAWPEADIIGFTFYHVARAIAEEQIRCNSLEPTAKQSCFDQVPILKQHARDEARHLLIAKGTAYGEREAAQRNARDRQLQREYLEAKGKQEQQDREDRREAAALLGLGLALSGGGPFRVPMAPVYQAPAFTPAPYQYLAPRQPTNCTSNIVGSYVYTNCY